MFRDYGVSGIFYLIQMPRNGKIDTRSSAGVHWGDSDMAYSSCGSSLFPEYSLILPQLFVFWFSAI